METTTKLDKASELAVIMISEKGVFHKWWNPIMIPTQ